MIQEEREPTTVDEHPGHFGHSFVDRLDVLEHEAGHYGIERAVGERQPVGPRAKVRRPAPAPDCLCGLGIGRVRADYQRRAALGG